MPLANEAAWKMRQICDHWNIGYSQPDRWNIAPGGNCDCSSACAGSYNLAGISPGFPADTYTGNLRPYSAARGFAVLDYAGVGPHPENLAIGDMLLSEAASGGTGHVAMVTGFNELSEAWISETGDIDGAPGDQTGGETRTVAFTDHPNTLSGTWTHLLRPPLDAPAPSVQAASTPTTTHPNTERNTDMPTLIRADLPNGPAYALVYLTGLGGARTLTQEEANDWYAVTGVRVVSYERWWKLVEEAWKANNAYLEALGRQVTVSVAEAVDALRKELATARKDVTA